MVAVTRRFLRVLIAGPDGEPRSSLSERVRAGAGVGVCGEARDGPGAVRAAFAERADVCLVAAEPGFDADGVVDALVRDAPNVPVVVTGPEPDDDALLDAVDAGASGYVAADLDATRLASALLDAASGLPAFPPRLAVLLITQLHDEPRAP